MTGHTSLRRAPALAPPGSASINGHEFLMLRTTHGVEVAELSQVPSPIVDIVVRWEELFDEPIPLGKLRELARNAVLNHVGGLGGMDGPGLDDLIVETLANPDFGLRVVRLRRGRSR